MRNLIKRKPRWQIRVRPWYIKTARTLKQVERFKLAHPYAVIKRI